MPWKALNIPKLLLYWISMKKREELLTWALAFAVFLLIAWLVASYSYREDAFSLLSFWKLFGLSVEPYFFYFLFLFPALYLLVKRFTALKILKNVLLVNSFLLPVYFFFQFVGESENLFYPAYPSLVSTWLPGMQPSWFPFFLLVTVLALLLALLAIFSEKFKLLKNSYFKWSLALSIATIFFLECLLVSFAVYDSNSRLSSYLVNENCAKKVSANWTPEYIKGLNAKYLPDAERYVEAVSSGKTFVTASERALGLEHLKYSYLNRMLASEFQQQLNSCFFEKANKADFPEPGFVTALFFIPVSIVCLLFSLKVFRRKHFANPVLEKGFLIAAIPLWSLGIAKILAPSALGIAHHSALYPVLNLGVFIVSVSIILPVAYWLGIWPRFSKKKK